MSDSPYTADHLSDETIPDDITLSYPANATIGEMSKQIAKSGPQLLDAWSKDNPFVVLVRTTQGTGKSTGLAERIAFYMGFVAMFAPRHADIEEDLDESPLGNRFKHHFRGKDEVCNNDDYAGKHFRVPNNVSQEWCEDCSQRGDCEYFTPYKAVGSWNPDETSQKESLKASAPSFMAVHQHLGVLPDVFGDDNGTWEYVNAVLIDESPYQTVVVDSVTAELKDIRAELDVLRQIDLDDDNVVRLVDEAVDLLDITKSVIETNGDSLTLYEDWIDFHEKYEKHDTAFGRKVAEQWGEQPSRDGNPVVLSILDTIPDVETVIEDAVTNNRALNREVAVKYLWSISEEDEPKLTISYANLSILREVARDKPVFALATEWPREIAEVVFDLPIVEITDDLKPAVDVLQLESFRAGIWALNQEKRLARNLRELTALAVRRESLRDRKAVVVCKMDIEESVRKKLTDEGLVEGEDFEVAHYYGLSGSNQYEDCGAVVLHGTPGFSDDVIRLNHLMTGIPEERLEFEKCQGEVRDALHRIRASQKDGVRAYIWTNEPDFRPEFDGSYFEKSIPQLKEKLNDEIENEQDRREDEQYVIEQLKMWDGWMTGTEFKTEVGEQYLSVRDRLAKEDRIEYKRKSGRPGRPTKKYRYTAPVMD